MSTTENRKAAHIRNASPELFTALEELAEMFEGSQSAELRSFREGGYNDPVIRLYDESISNARKALAKARGES